MASTLPHLEKSASRDAFPQHHPFSKYEKISEQSGESDQALKGGNHCLSNGYSCCWKALLLREKGEQSGKAPETNSLGAAIASLSKHFTISLPLPVLFPLDHWTFNEEKPILLRMTVEQGGRGNMSCCAYKSLTSRASQWNKEVQTVTHVNGTSQGWRSERKAAKNSNSEQHPSR